MECKVTRIYSASSHIYLHDEVIVDGVAVGGVVPRRKFAGSKRVTVGWEAWRKGSRFLFSSQNRIFPTREDAIAYVVFPTRKSAIAYMAEHTA
jgi:hypothetical protein